MRVKRSVWTATIMLAIAASGCNGHLFPWSRTSAGPRTYVKPNVLPLQPAEGMWVYNHLPEGRLRTLFNFDVTKAWANNLQLASVRLGASGAFVSPDGLILTNHHVAAGGLQNASGPGKDYVSNGFLAKRVRRDQAAGAGAECSGVDPGRERAWIREWTRAVQG